MKKIVIFAFLLCAASLYVYFTRIVPARQYDPTLRGSGQIETTQVLVSGKIASRILEIAVEEGAQVEAGQVLVKLDCDEIEARCTQAEAQVAQAEAALAQAEAAKMQARSSLAPLVAQQGQARRDFERARTLFESKSLPENRYEQAKTAYDTLTEQINTAEKAVKVAERATGVAAAQVGAAKAAVKLAETGLDECELKAPISGRVSARNYEPGEIAMPGAALLKIDRTEDVYTYIYIPNEEVGRVSVGQKVRVVADTFPDRNFEGVVQRINSEAEFTPKSIQTKEDRTRLVFGVKVVLANADGLLRPGMPVEAVWDTK